MVEKAFENAREIEVSVLGDDNPIVSIPGEIIPSNEFYIDKYVPLFRSSRSSTMEYGKKTDLALGLWVKFARAFTTFGK